MTSVALKDFGSYRVGGRVHVVCDQPIQQIAFTASTHYTHNPNGHYCVESAYVQYFVPAQRNTLPPIVLLHGGGMSGSMWENTPDGRPGWLHRLLHKGYEVHIIDNMERGRAGWLPNLWSGTPVSRTLEEAWTLFRLGKPEDFATRKAYPQQQFPVSHLENFGLGFVPRWTSTSALQVKTLKALLQKLGQVILLCHSQGGEIGFTAASQLPQCVAQLITIEPSGFCEQAKALAHIPISIVYGDYLEHTDIWRTLRARWSRFSYTLKEHGAQVQLIDLATVCPGASHFPMMDQASDQYLDAILAKVA